MNLKDYYDKIGGDYDGVVSRLLSDERVKKYVIRFPEDKTFELLGASLGARDYAEAFRAAHTLKGLSLNLGFGALYSAVYEITEALRPQKEADGLDEMLAKVKEAYELTVSYIKDID